MPVPELSPTEFVQRWPNLGLGSAVVLLDVREHVELEIASVPSVVHVPMREIPLKLAEFDRDTPIVVMCHSGGRSRRVAEYLLGNGFSQVFNLRGGIDAWSTEIDPQVPRY
jgi:rhodanese-related sulfurtransferase